MINGVYESGERENRGIFFKLEADGPRTMLVVVDKRGDMCWQGRILSIHNATGTIALHSSISRKFGFNLDDDGYLATVKIQ